MGKKRKRQPMREFFTQAERKKLLGKYGKVTKRLNSNSKREFDCCCLCLNSCIQPMLSPYGFLYCKECILRNLVEQKKQIKKKLKEEKGKMDVVNKKRKMEKEKAKEQKRILFERQNSFISSSNDESSNSSGKKSGPFNQNMFWLTKDELQKGQSGEDSTMLGGKREKKKKKQRTVDPMCSKKLRFKDLVAVNFKEVRVEAKQEESVHKNEFRKEDSGISKSRRETICCPHCLKVLSQQIEACVIKNCGCCFCMSCVNSFIKKSMICCERKILHMSEIVKLEVSGSGFCGGKGKATSTVNKLGFKFS